MVSPAGHRIQDGIMGALVFPNGKVVFQLVKTETNVDTFHLSLCKLDAEGQMSNLTHLQVIKHEISLNGCLGHSRPFAHINQTRQNNKETCAFFKATLSKFGHR